MGASSAFRRLSGRLRRPGLLIVVANVSLFGRMPVTEAAPVASKQTLAASASDSLTKADGWDRQVTDLIATRNFRSAVFIAENAFALRQKVASRDLGDRIAMVKCLTNLLRCFIFLNRSADEKRLVGTFQAYIAADPSDMPAEYANAIATFKRIASTRNVDAAPVAPAPRGAVKTMTHAGIGANSGTSANSGSPTVKSTAFGQATASGGSTSFGLSLPKPATNSPQQAGADADALDARVAPLIEANDFKSAMPLAEKAVALRQTVNSKDIVVRLATMQSLCNLLRCCVEEKRVREGLQTVTSFNAYRAAGPPNEADSSSEFGRIGQEFYLLSLKIDIIADPKNLPERMQLALNDPDNNADASTHPTPTGDLLADKLDEQVAELMIAKNFEAAIPLA